MELLAKATASEDPCSPLDIDESTGCGSPGKVVDASTLHQIMQVKADGQVYYATGVCLSIKPYVYFWIFLKLLT